MLKAVLRKGVIVPLEPVPAEWEEGAALQVDMVRAEGLGIDSWATEMDRLCADSAAEDEEAMRRAIDERRRQAKDFAAGNRNTNNR